MVAVRLDDGDLAAGLSDRRHRDDMAVVWMGEARQQLRREVVSACHSGEGPLPLFGEVRDDDDIAWLEPVKLGVEELSVRVVQRGKQISEVAVHLHRDRSTQGIPG